MQLIDFVQAGRYAALAEEDEAEAVPDPAVTARAAMERLSDAAPPGTEAYVKEADAPGGFAPVGPRRRAARVRQLRTADAGARGAAAACRGASAAGEGTSRPPSRACRAAMGLLARDGPQLAPVGRPTDPGHRVVRAVIDSGAEDTVAPPNVLPGTVQPSPMSKAGLTYRSASGEPIKNLGQTTVQFEDGRQRRCGMHFQVAEVDRPLISVVRLVDAGNRVVFGPTGGFIAHVATGRRVQLVRDGNVYTLDMHLPPEPAGEKGQKEVEVTHGPEDAPTAGFARPERR